MKGYYKNPEQTRLAIRDGWLHTGDIGLFDDEGYLHLTDRRRDLIISGGFNVYPSEVEQVIWGHPAVRDCAVVGSPHPDWGEAVTAVVELNENCSVTEQELIALCKQELGSIRAPKAVHLVPAPAPQRQRESPQKNHSRSLLARRTNQDLGEHQCRRD